jgi:hypothetical protein
MGWKDKLRPGFLGQAMREQEAELKEMGSNAEQIDLAPEKSEVFDEHHAEDMILNNIVEDMTEDEINEQLINTNTKKEEQIMENITEQLNEAPAMTTPKVTAKVISGKNQAELESKLNDFLATITPNQQIEDTKFATTNVGLYYTILLSTRLERV